jgi:hypothetical protein
VASDEAKALSDWVEAVSRELGLDRPFDGVGLVDVVLDLTSDVARGVSRPGATVTAFLIGVAAGRSEDPAVAARDYAEKIGRLAGTWDPDSA